MGDCSEPNCPYPIRAVGLCKYHYAKKKYGSKYSLKHRDKNRLLLIDYLSGGKCTCQGCSWHNGPCEVDDEGCIQLDHINGGGHKDVMKFKSMTNMYKYYSEHTDEAKKELQPLCANCNWVKRMRNRENADFGKQKPELIGKLYARNENGIVL